MITQTIINAFFRISPATATDIAGNVVDVVAEEQDHMKRWVEIDERFGVMKGNYAINRLGEVKNLKHDKKLKSYFCKSSGYLCVSINRAVDMSGNFIRPSSGLGRKVTREKPRPDSLMLIHRLVAMVFIPNNNPKFKIIDHIDGNPLNNNYKNLRWCNQRINSNNMKNNTKYWSVRWAKNIKKWYGNVITTINNNPHETFCHSLGSFDGEEEAAKAVKKFMIETYPNEMGGGRRFIDD